MSPVKNDCRIADYASGKSGKGPVRHRSLVICMPKTYETLFYQKLHIKKTNFLLIIRWNSLTWLASLKNPRANSQRGLNLENFQIHLHQSHLSWNNIKAIIIGEVIRLRKTKNICQSSVNPAIPAINKLAICWTKQATGIIRYLIKYDEKIWASVFGIKNKNVNQTLL